MAGKLVRNRSTPELSAWWDEIVRLAALAPRLLIVEPISGIPELRADKEKK